MSGGSEGTWWKTLIGGVFLIGLSVFLYFYFTDFEATGGNRRMNAIIAALYNLGGKWLVCSLLGVLGVGVVAVGIKEYKNQK